MKSNLLESDCLEDKAAMADYYYHEDENIGMGNVKWIAFRHSWSLKRQQY
jgi:hypothetical protein